MMDHQPHPAAPGWPLAANPSPSTLTHFPQLRKEFGKATAASKRNPPGASAPKGDGQHIVGAVADFECARVILLLRGCHEADRICAWARRACAAMFAGTSECAERSSHRRRRRTGSASLRPAFRSEEHTSELQ